MIVCGGWLRCGSPHRANFRKSYLNHKSEVVKKGKELPPEKVLTPEQQERDDYLREVGRALRRELKHHQGRERPE
jgi:hypothetical protein